jgi:hypothetical protein
MGPIKTSQFAELWLVGEKLADTAVFEPSKDDLNEMSGTAQNPAVVKAGIVTQLRIQENLNSTQRNVIGTPVPVFMPGYYQATISADKATLDMKSFKTMINMNPLSAFRTDTYSGADGVNKLKAISEIAPFLGSGDNNDISGAIPRFTFLLFVKDLIAGVGSPKGEASTNIGIFVCMLQNFNVTLSSTDSVIMESITMLARPVVGSWFSALASTYNLSPGFGYDHNIKPLLPGK